MIFVTGGAGFIGSNFVLDWMAKSDEPVTVLDKLTYAGNLENLARVRVDPRYAFERVDICDRQRLEELFGQLRPRALVHFAAESHVDRSIHGPGEFVKTNVDGTFQLLEATRGYVKNLGEFERTQFRFLHVSTDEVYGSLGPNDPPFTETTAYAPNSPYAASKASSDHLVRAYFHTYGLPVLTTNCSNNYGPFQFPEKLIPLMILNALEGRPLPVYGDGQNVRDWLYVTDHCEGVRCVLERGRVGETYNIGGRAEMKNMEVVHAICRILQELRPSARPYERLIEFVKDRPGHDRRYAIAPDKIERELGWRPAATFDSGMRRTVQWYLENEEWVNHVKSGHYRDWVEQHYGTADAHRQPARSQ